MTCRKVLDDEIVLARPMIDNLIINIASHDKFCILYEDCHVILLSVPSVHANLAPTYI